MEYTVVKFKRTDTNKPWVAGNVKEGKYGPQIGMKMTPELRAYLDSVQMGSWLNFNLYKPYEEKQPDKANTPQLDDEFPF